MCTSKIATVMFATRTAALDYLQASCLPLHNQFIQSNAINEKIIAWNDVFKFMISIDEFDWMIWIKCDLFQLRGQGVIKYVWRHQILHLTINLSHWSLTLFMVFGICATAAAATAAAGVSWDFWSASGGKYIISPWIGLEASVWLYHWLVDYFAVNHS